MATVQNQNQSIPNEDFISLKELASLYLSNWYWFALSLFVCLTIAIIYLITTPPVYTRYASVLIKQDAKGRSVNADVTSSISDLGMFRSRSNINNEIINFQSPNLMFEVVKRLHLNVDYKTDGAFYDRTLYGDQLPVTVSFDDMKNNESAIRLGFGISYINVSKSFSYGISVLKPYNGVGFLADMGWRINSHFDVGLRYRLFQCFFSGSSARFIAHEVEFSPSYIFADLKAVEFSEHDFVDTIRVRIESGAVIVPVEIAGQERHLLFDTGAEHGFWFGSQEEWMKPTDVDSAKWRDINDKTGAASVFKIPEMRMGNLGLSNYPVSVGGHLGDYILTRRTV